MVQIKKNVTISIALKFVFNAVVFVQSSVGIPCGDGEFPCNDGKCIDTYRWCDSNKDCSDGSDEAYCRKNTFFDKNPNKCSNKFFKCHDGPCIPLNGRCDGYFSCDDNSDEKDCLEEVYSEYTSFSSATQTPLTKADDSRTEEIGIYRELNPSEFSLQREKARKWITSQRLQNFGWGSETPRALTALYLSDVHRFKRNETDRLMVKQLEIQLALDIARNGTKALGLTDLALYINALMISCKDPGNFYGNDLVSILRCSVNTSRNAGKFVNPAVYLTLCLNNDTTHEDARSLHEIFHSQNAALGRIDIQALSMLTTTCAFHYNKSMTAETYEGFKKQFLNKLKSKNFTGNIYEAALVMQVSSIFVLYFISIVLAS
ncbi:UNVERIFIED_CONTAM: Sspo [Trichonephila clavipes]